MRLQRALPGLYETPERVELTPRKAVNVPRSSVEAHQRTHAETRISAVLEWLQAMSRWHHEAPTSAELARWRWRDQGYRGPAAMDCVLYIRRGLSDALAKGLVEHGPKRACKVVSTLAVTWKVRSR